MKIVILNAPPLAGKDTIADFMVENEGYSKFMFKDKLIEAAVLSSGISRKVWDAFYEREYKEKPNHYLRVNGEKVSPRQYLIHISESVMKPLFGEGVFGLALRDQILSSGKDKIIISDGGFESELQPLIAEFGVDSILVIHLSRNGCTFKGDSRSFVYSGHYTSLYNYEDDLELTIEELKCSIEEYFYE